MSSIPTSWLSENPISLDQWTITCTIHNPPKVTDYLLQRAESWITSENKVPTPDLIRDRAGQLAWKDTNDLHKTRPITVRASEFIKATFKSDDLSSFVNKSGRTEENGKQSVPLACFVTWLSQEEWNEYYPTPQDANMNEKQWKSWARHVSRVDKVQAMAFDFDGVSDSDMESIFESFAQLTYIAYSSFSHKAPHKQGKCSFRIIVPMTRALSPLEYNNSVNRKGFWFNLMKAFPQNDEQTKDPTRLWYMPSYRADREEHFFTRTNEGYALNVDAVIGTNTAQVQSATAQSSPTQSSTTNASQNASQSGAEPSRRGRGRPRRDQTNAQNQQNQDIPTGEEIDQGVDQDAAQRAVATETSYRREFVKGDWEVRCHDDELRHFSWIIENWDSLPKQANGNYNCCRPNSHTVGSAFVHVYRDSTCELPRYRMTSVPSQTHWDCLETDYGITITYDRRNLTGMIFHPNQNRQNISKMVKVLQEEGLVNVFSCKRNNIGYVDGERLGTGHMFDIESHIVARWFPSGVHSSIIRGGIEGYVHETRHDALVEYLNGLERVEGATDLETVFIRYLNVTDTPLHRKMSKKWFIGAVARALDHGCQNDTVLIFSGAQGVGKTTFWKAIAGKCHYTGRPYHKEGKVDINNKDSLLAFLQAWIFEWGELAGMDHKSKEDFKLLTSQQENTIRKAYGVFEDDILRKGVIVGSCNPDQNPLIDEENRRIWLMHCNTNSGEFSYERDALLDEVDAIWAEAVYEYKQGIKAYNKWGKPIYKENLWWLSEDERKEHIVVNEDMKDDDIHYGMFYDFVLANPCHIMSGDEIVEKLYNETYIDKDGTEKKRVKALKPPHKKEISRMLRKIGCEYKAVRVNGHPCKRWVFPMIEPDYDTSCEYEVNYPQPDREPKAKSSRPYDRFRDADISEKPQSKGPSNNSTSNSKSNTSNSKFSFKMDFNDFNADDYGVD